MSDLPKNLAIFSSSDLRECLTILRITTSELAELFSINERTVSRWINNEIAVPGPASCALKAWCTLERLGLPWRPDGLALLHAKSASGDPLALSLDPKTEVSKIVNAIKLRGGPSLPWKVDVDKREATLADIWIKFRPLSSNQFVPQSYGRSDIRPDLVRDKHVIEEGFASISDALRKSFEDNRKLEWKETKV